MNTTQENELIYIDEKGLKQARIELIKSGADLNRFVQESGKILKRELTKAEKERLRTGGLKHLESEVKKLFKFPDATDDFNLQTLGIDLTEARKHRNGSWGPYDWELDEQGKFTAKEVQPAFDTYYHRADTDLRRDAIKLAKDLIALVAEAERLNLLQGEHLGGAAQAFSNVVIPCGDIGRHGMRLKVNQKGIATTEPKRG